MRNDLFESPFQSAWLALAERQQALGHQAWGKGSGRGGSLSGKRKDLLRRQQQGWLALLGGEPGRQEGLFQLLYRLR